MAGIDDPVRSLSATMASWIISVYVLLARTRTRLVADVGVALLLFSSPSSSPSLGDAAAAGGLLASSSDLVEAASSESSGGELAAAAFLEEAGGDLSSPFLAGVCIQESKG